jgi:hypothetical protein
MGQLKISGAIPRADTDRLSEPKLELTPPGLHCVLCCMFLICQTSGEQMFLSRRDLIKGCTMCLMLHRCGPTDEVIALDGFQCNKRMYDV